MLAARWTPSCGWSVEGLHRKGWRCSAPLWHTCLHDLVRLWFNRREPSTLHARAISQSYAVSTASMRN